jgi:signal transduction histidine kinase/ActR/RegA family two-component response regulator
MHFAVAAETAPVADSMLTDERLRQVIRLSNIGVFEHDHATDEVYWSPEQREIYGVGADEALAFTSQPAAGSSSGDFHTWSLIHPDDRAQVAEAMQRAHAGEDGLFDLEYRIVRRDGIERWIATRSQTFFRGEGAARRAMRTIGATQDITDRKRLDAEQWQLERQANRAQRLESIGTLAGGIAHDLNNALTPILMMLDLLKEQYPAEAEALETVERSANHAAEMVRHLLSFAKGNEGRRLQLQPRLLIKEMEKIVKGTFPKNIRIQMRCPRELPGIVGDATQLHQVLLNLCVNARDAMPDGGVLTLEAGPAEASDVGSDSTRRYVVLRVMDTGTGIEPDMLERIFDPFFSTKGPDKGTGLGLFTAAGIVKGHDGFIRVHSNPGQGSTFAVLLPVVAGASDVEPERESASTFLGNRELILYVDDESEVRTAARAVLARLNFMPLIAKDAMGGLLQAMQHRTELRAVITDLHMPQMDGLAFVRALRRALPDIPVIVASGRLDGGPAKELKRLGVTVLLDKPFTQTMLANALRAVIGPKDPQPV